MPNPTETTHEPERRFLSLSDMELRVEEREDGAGLLTGYPIVYHQLSVQMFGFREQVQPGAFDDSLRDDDILALINHDRNHVLGRTASKTARLSSDEKGVRMEVDLPDRQDARDLVVSLGRRDISGGSFSFRVLPGGDDWAEDGDGVLIRTIKSGKLFDVGPVASPAYPDTNGTMSARSAEDALRSLEEWRASQDAARNSWRASSALRERLLQIGAA